MGAGGAGSGGREEERQTDGSRARRAEEDRGRERDQRGTQGSREKGGGEKWGINAVPLHAGPPATWWLQVMARGDDESHCWVPGRSQAESPVR